MSEKKIISAVTDVSVDSGDLTIFTYFGDKTNYLSFFFAGVEFKKNGTEFIEGELGYSQKGYKDVSFYINEQGELIVISDDVDRFAIDEDGQLTITE